MQRLEAFLTRYLEPVENWRQLVGPLLALWSMGALCIATAALAWMDAQRMLPPLK